MRVPKLLMVEVQNVCEAKKEYKSLPTVAIMILYKSIKLDPHRKLTDFFETGALELCRQAFTACFLDVFVDDFETKSTNLKNVLL